MHRLSNSSQWLVRTENKYSANFNKIYCQQFVLIKLLNICVTGVTVNMKLASLLITVEISASPSSSFLNFWLLRSTYTYTLHICIVISTEPFDCFKRLVSIIYIISTEFKEREEISYYCSCIKHFTTSWYMVYTLRVLTWDFKQVGDWFEYVQKTSTVQASIKVTSSSSCLEIF